MKIIANEILVGLCLAFLLIAVYQTYRLEVVITERDALVQGVNNIQPAKLRVENSSISNHSIPPPDGMSPERAKELQDAVKTSIHVHTN